MTYTHNTDCTKIAARWHLQILLTAFGAKRHCRNSHVSRRGLSDVAPIQGWHKGVGGGGQNFVALHTEVQCI
jgi:hypothetical protein